MVHPARAAALDQRVDELLGQFVVPGGPGYAILVMDEYEPLLLKGYGFARIADPQNGIKEEPITPGTVFDLASMSKQFTAIAILMLVDGTTRHGSDGGKYSPLQLDTPLRIFFPNIPAAERITIQMLLSHSSGLPDYFTIEPFLNNYKRELRQIGFWYATMQGKPSYLTNEQVLELIERESLIFAPGENSEYCNTGYVVLAEIIRKVTGKSLRVFLKEEIFDRLEMDNTFVYDETVAGFDSHALCYRKRRTTGQIVSMESDTQFNYIHGDGNVHSTMADMMKWQIACNRIDELEDLDVTGRGPLIKRSTFLTVFEPLIQRYTVLRYRPPTSGYSAGFFIYRYINRNVSDFVLHHSGDWLGFHSYVVRAQVQFREGIAPENWKRISVVVLSPTQLLAPTRRVNAVKIAKRIARLYWQFWGLPARYNVLRYI
jgi:CubicO group peptidase (beta-lactamase class C family)